MTKQDGGAGAVRILGEPGHYDPRRPRDGHFLGLCDECDAHYLARMSLGQVEGRYRCGSVRRAMYEAYLHAWATGAARFSSLGDRWQAPPDDPEVCALLGMLRAAYAARER